MLAIIHRAVQNKLYGPERPVNWLRRFFAFDDRNTTLAREVLAGLTTFTTMSYIVVVNPGILSTAGIPKGRLSLQPRW